MADLAVIDNATNQVVNVIVAELSDLCPDGCRFELAAVDRGYLIGSIVLPPEPVIVPDQAA